MNANELVIKHTPQVRQMARRFFLQGAEREDLIQEGMSGLAYAISSFKPEVGKEFSDYASMCIRNALVRAVRLSTRKKRLVLSQAGELDENVAPPAKVADPARQVMGKLALSDLVGKLRQGLSGQEYDSLMRRAGGWSLEEIARRQATSSKQVENAIFRARRKARALAS